jgi:hypothetical protein
MPTSNRGLWDRQRLSPTRMCQSITNFSSLKQLEFIVPAVIISETFLPMPLPPLPQVIGGCRDTTILLLFTVSRRSDVGVLSNHLLLAFFQAGSSSLLADEIGPGVAVIPVDAEKYFEIVLIVLDKNSTPLISHLLLNNARAALRWIQHGSADAKITNRKSVIKPGSHVSLQFSYHTAVTSACLQCTG